MRQQKLALLILLLACAQGWCIERKPPVRKPTPVQKPVPAPVAKPTEPAQLESAPANSDLAASGNLDDLLRDLIGKLEKDRNTAADAAVKLGRLGKRAVPVLTELIERNSEPEAAPAEDGKPAQIRPANEAKPNPHLLYYSVMALSRIKLAEAARPLLPLLRSEKTGSDLRTMIIEAPGMELLDEGAALLQKIAGGDGDSVIRKKALSQLSLMAKYWAQSEKLYTDSLSDPDEEIRLLAAKQCYWTMIYVGATEKLIEMAENDPAPAVRVQSILALGRMRAKSSVPALIRILQSPQSLPQSQQVALRSLQVLTTIPFKDATAAGAWWTKSGEKEYSKFEIPVAVPQPPVVAPPVVTEAAPAPQPLPPDKVAP